MPSEQDHPRIDLVKPSIDKDDSNMSDRTATIEALVQVLDNEGEEGVTSYVDTLLSSDKDIEERKKLIETIVAFSEGRVINRLEQKAEYGLRGVLGEASTLIELTKTTPPTARQEIGRLSDRLAALGTTSQTQHSPLIAEVVSTKARNADIRDDQATPDRGMTLEFLALLKQGNEQKLETFLKNTEPKDWAIIDQYVNIFEAIQQPLTEIFKKGQEMLRYNGHPDFVQQIRSGLIKELEEVVAICSKLTSVKAQ